MQQRILNLLLLLTLALSASADNLGYSKDKPLLFGIDMDYAPMEYIDGRGIPRGFDVEFTRRLMERMDIPFTFAPNTWANIAGAVGAAFLHIQEFRIPVPLIHKRTPNLVES